MQGLAEAGLIGVGGFAGALARHWVSSLNTSEWPAGTMTANLLGAFVLGLLSVRLAHSPTLGPLVLVGFLGSFTTFSTLCHESIDRNHKGHGGQGRSVMTNTLYLLVSVLCGVLLSYIGEKIGSRM